MRSPHATLALVLLLPSAIGLSSCDSKRRVEAEAPAAASRTEVARDREGGAASNLSGDPGATFGAAAWIPEDAAFFSSALRLREQWDLVTESRAIAHLLELPTVQMILMQAKMHPGWRRFEHQRQNHPFVKAVVDLAVDAVSSELFLYADARCADFLNALNEVYRRAWFTAMTGALDADASRDTSGDRRQRRNAARVQALIAAVAERAEDIRVPPLVLGFRLSKPQEAARILPPVMAQVGGLARGARLVRERVGAGEFHSAYFDGAAIPPGSLALMSQRMLREGVPPALVGKLLDQLRSQTLVFSVGLRESYLLFSLGPDTEHLRRLGPDRSLARSHALTPLRRRFKPGLISLSYVDERLCFPGAKLDGAKVDAWLTELVESLREDALPQGLLPRLRRDVRALVHDLNEWLPEPLPFVAASFLNEGIESYSFSAHIPGSWDDSTSLSIFSKAGARPLFACAFRSAPAAASYDRLAHWMEVAYGYVKDYALGNLGPAHEADVRRFESIIVPAVKELWETTRSYLIPALDGRQGLFVADARGLVRSLPGEPAPLRQPLVLPRPALVMEVSDADLLTTAWSRYRESVNAMLGRLAAADGSAAAAVIPAPESRPHARGTLYTYPLPDDLERRLGIEPHVLVTSRYAIVSLDPSQSLEVAKTVTRPSSKVVRLEARSGAAHTIDLERIVSIIVHDARVLLDHAVAAGNVSPDSAHLMALHLPVVEKVLSTLKSHSARAYLEDGLAVRHSWLRVEDLADE